MDFVIRLSKKQPMLATMVLMLLTMGLSCSSNTNVTKTPTNPAYQLTHTAADAEFIISWNSIVSQCPDVGNYDKLEAFGVRGQTVEIAPGETVSLDADSPAAWASTRMVRTGSPGGTFRSFGVQISFFDTSEYLDEYIQSIETSGISFQGEGDFKTAEVESESPVQSLQMILAGRQFAISFIETASASESLFCNKEDLMNLLPDIKTNISSLEITNLPANVPNR